jgi:hypothetical protein
MSNSTNKNFEPLTENAKNETIQSKNAAQKSLTIFIGKTEPKTENPNSKEISEDKTDVTNDYKTESQEILNANSSYTGENLNFCALISGNYAVVIKPMKIITVLLVYLQTKLLIFF